MRSRIGYQSGDFKGFKALVEFENIANIGDDRFNSTTNGKVFLPVVADPKTAEVYRAQLSYKAGDTNITVGRQRIILDTARFVGNVGFRQNEQTFDAVQLVNTSIDGLKASYIYINKVHRIFGDNHPAGNFTGDTHLANV